MDELEKLYDQLRVKEALLNDAIWDFGEACKVHRLSEERLKRHQRAVDVCRLQIKKRQPI